MQQPRLMIAKPVVEGLKSSLTQEVAEFARRYRRSPRLAVVLVGQDPASVIYTRKKGEMAVALGMEHETLNFPGTATPAEVKAAVDRLNADPNVDGILIQRPLPKGFNEEEVLYWVSPEKDVDAFHPVNAGRLMLGLPCFQPCTPTGVMELLKHYGINPAGKIACVIGRSSIVGKPMSALLLQANATVFQCHSRTPDLPRVASQADIVVGAVGKAEMIGADFIKPGAVVIDVGINRRADGKVVGDVAFEACAAKASAITPVPGGVGPMTIMILMKNTLFAANQRSSKGLS